MSIQTEIDEPEWPEILRAVQSTLQARIHVSIPCIVRSYDSVTQLAEVEFAVQLDADKKVPPLSDVPVMWPGGVAGFLHIPLEAGDTVLVVFSEEDYSKWWDSGSVSTPAVLQRHGLHAVAIPGLRARGDAFPATGGHATLAASELRLGSDAASVFVALASLVDARLAAIVSYINTHIHTGVTTGAGVSGVPSVLISAQASVAATKVKAE